MGRLVVFFDSNILIYFIENNEEFGTEATRALSKAIDGEGVAFSVLALTETLSRRQPASAANKLKQLESAVHFIDVDKEVAKLAGSLRQKHPALKTPDALHLATALAQPDSSFVTNDLALYKRTKPLLKNTYLLRKYM